MAQNHDSQQSGSYKDTLNLPRTDFPIRANAAENDPLVLKRWSEEDLYTATFNKNAGREKFIIHDGPPYANGHIHLGHAYNKILKDIVGKSRRMNGYHVPITPGWDCHGLPIELKVTQEFPDLPKDALKTQCRLYAKKWVEVQKEEFKELGVLMDWQHPYLTMDFSYEAGIIQAFGSLVEKGYIEKKLKTVAWCPTDQTVLASAEIEYRERKDPSVYVLFPLTASSQQELFPSVSVPLSLAIWTTTPWTLPLNRAVLLKPQTLYQVLQVDDYAFIVAQDLADLLLKKIEKPKKVIAEIQSEELLKAYAQHPFIDSLQVPLILDPMVSTQEGTALVHCAPGCGPQDYEIGLKHSLEIFSPVSPAGKYTTGILPKTLEGMPVSEGQFWVLKTLKEHNRLLHKESITHSYPHCWRCRNGLIFRATSQWFCNLSHNNLRDKALNALESLKFLPARSINFLKATLEGRLEWCLSRQRTWGVPIPALLCRECDHVFTDVALIQEVARGVAQSGIEYWDNVKIENLPIKKCPQCSSETLTKEKDILDVWFDSGVSHYVVLYKNRLLDFPASLYAEGVDQHRGWFQSSLLTSMILEEKPCTEAFLTHGFVVDHNGYKMSKSLGNVVSPQDLIKKLGTDGLRLWASSIDYANDAPVSEVLVQNVGQVYRKIRNTCRFLLSNLYDFNHSSDAISLDSLLLLDQYALIELLALTREIKNAYEAYDFTQVFHALNEYCTVGLSQIYLDVTKDRLYTQAQSSRYRRSAQTAMWYILDTITKLMAPILSFTAELISDQYQENKTQSIHLQEFPSLQAIENMIKNYSFGGGMYDQSMPSTASGSASHSMRIIGQQQTAENLQDEWNFIVELRSAFLKAIEEQRKEGHIKHSLEAGVKVYIDVQGPRKDYYNQLLNRLKISGQTFEDFLKELLVVSYIELVGTPADLTEIEHGIFAQAFHAEGIKCPRCWHWTVTDHHDGLCQRCIKALGHTI